MNPPTNIGSMNPFDFDTKVQQASALLAKNNVPQDQIDAVTQQLQDQYKQANGGSAGSSGILGTGFGGGTVDEAQANEGITPDAYKTQEAAQGPVKPISPLMPGDNPLLGIPKTIPNAISDVPNIVGGLGSVLAHPIQTVEDIYKNPAMMAGPAASNLLEGTGNALGDLLAGNFSQAGTQFLSGVDKAWTGFVDHPILSLPIVHGLGVLSDELGITTPKTEIDPATGKPKAPVTLKSDIAAKTAAVTRVLSDPKAAAITLGQNIIAPFRNLMPKATGDAAANIIAGRLNTTLGQINNLTEAQDDINSRPDFNAEAGHIQSAIDSTNANIRQADTDLVTAQKEDTALAQGIVKVNAAATTEAITSGIGAKVDSTNQAVNGGYQNLKAPDGTRIPVVSTTPLADSIEGFVNDNKELFNPKAITSVTNDIFRLRAQNYAGQGMSLADIYKTMLANGEGTAEQFANNPANFLKNPLTADQLKIVRDRVAGNITEGLTPAAKSTALALYSKATSGAFNDMLSTSVDPVNPEGANAVRSSDTAFKNLLATQEKYGITTDSTGKVTEFNPSKVEANFSSFKQDFPDQARQYGQMKAAEVVKDAQTISKTGVQGLNYGKLNSGLEENASFIPTDIYSQIKSIISKSYTDNALHDDVVSKANALQSSLQDKLAETNANEKISPSDPEDFEKTLENTKTYADFQQLSQTSGIPPKTLGDMFLRQSAMRNFGETTDISKLSTQKILAGAKGMLKEYDALGGTSKTESLKNEMFGDNNAQMENMRADVAKAETAIKQGGRTILKNIGTGIMGGLAIMVGHSLMGAGLLRRSLSDLTESRITEDIPGRSSGPTFKSMGKATGDLIRKNMISTVIPIANTQQK